ncbi:MAG TPA: alpha/beta fold hydrolase [Acidimicrobiales bacterium]|nr:alpha/beta fold hydrolase [Acidimicrobiales bacterium]
MTEGYVETNGVRLWYEDRGHPDAEAVVLVMGATASAISWPDELLDALTAQGLRVVRFDNRDIGLSTHVDYATAPYTLDDMADDTVGLMDALGIARAHLVGASMGGMISQVIALRFPERVRSLALLITSPGPDERLSPTNDEVLTIATRQADTDEDLAQRGVDLWRVLTGTRFPFDEAAIRATAQRDAERGTNPNSAHAIAVFTAPSRVDALADVQVPTIVVHGTEDPIFPLDHGRTLAEVIPGATLLEWEGVGHEIPAPLADELLDALRSNIAAAVH